MKSETNREHKPMEVTHTTLEGTTGPLSVVYGKRVGYREELSK